MEVRAELDKIQNSDPFVRSQRIRRLLEFLVESTLAGKKEELKESLIGVEVFDRSPDYDCKQDPVVRVEMRRLRSKLSEYYLHEGKSDEVRIWLEKGSYAPLSQSARQTSLCCLTRRRNPPPRPVPKLSSALQTNPKSMTYLAPKSDVPVLFGWEWLLFSH